MVNPILAAVWSKETSAIFYNFSTFVETDIKNIIKEHFIVLEDIEMLKLISEKKNKSRRKNITYF